MNDTTHLIPLRFVVGEMAITATQGKTLAPGIEVCVVARGPWPALSMVACHGEIRSIADGRDYLIEDAYGRKFGCVDRQLRKKRPPITADVRSLFEAKPVEVGS